MSHLWTHRSFLPVFSLLFVQEREGNRNRTEKDSGMLIKTLLPLSFCSSILCCRGTFLSFPTLARQFYPGFLFHVEQYRSGRPAILLPLKIGRPSQCGILVDHEFIWGLISLRTHDMDSTSHQPPNSSLVITRRLSG